MMKLLRPLAETVEKLSTFEWPKANEDLTEETVTKIIKKFKNHPSYLKIKSKYLTFNFLFSQFLLKM